MYRIVKYENEFAIQTKGWFYWYFVMTNDGENISDGQPYHYETKLTFASIQEAKDWIKKQEVKFKRQFSHNWEVVEEVE